MLREGIDQVKKDPHAGIFVIGATNRPDLLDERLSQPGRFDKLVYLGITESPVSRLKILEAQTRKLALSREVDLAIIEKEYLPKNLTGADFYALVSSSFLKALERKIEALEKEFSEQESQKAPEKRKVNSK